MIKTVYITGCLGFIGSYVTRACLEKGWYVRGVDKMTYASRPELLEEFNKYKEVNNNVEIVCTDGIPINYNLEKATDNDKIINMLVNVDTIDIVSKDLVAKANVRLQINPAI